MAEQLIEMGAVFETGRFAAGLRSMTTTAGSAIKTMVRLFADGANEVQAAFDAIEIGTELLDQFASTNVQLGNLSQQTGIAIDKLGGLKLLVEQTGADFKPFEDGLKSMRAAQLSAVQGNTTLAAAFQSMGISVADLQKLTPEQLMYRMASGLKNTKDAAGATSGAMKIFGDSGAALVPIFRGAGTELERMTSRAAQSAGVSKESEQAARQWKVVTAELGGIFQSLLAPALELVVPIVKGLGIEFAVTAANVGTLLSVGRTLVSAFVTEIRGMAHIIGDLLRGNFAAVERDAVALKNSMVNVFSSGAEESAKIWKTAAGRIKTFWAGEGITPDFSTLSVPPPASEGQRKAHGAVGHPKAAPAAKPAVEATPVQLSPAPQSETPATMPQGLELKVPPERIPAESGDTPEQKRVEAEIEAQLELTQINHQQLAMRVTQFKEFFGQVTGGFRNMTKALMEGTKSIGQVWKETWNNIARNFVSKLQDMLMNWITQHLSMLFVRLTTNEAMVASDAAAQDKSTKISFLGSIKKIGHDAASAAAKAFKAVMEGVPYPLNFVLAPLAAAGAFAGVIAFESLMQAEKGALLDQDQLVYAHKNEMILPAPLSAGLQNMLSLGVAPSPALRMPGSAPGTAPAARTAAIRNEHYNFNASISTIDAKGTAQWMRENSGIFYRLIRDGVRAGKLRPAEI